MAAYNKVISEFWRRSDIIDELSNKPSTRSEIEEKFGYSKSTAYKHLRKLEQLGICYKRDGEYSLTPYGKVVYQKYSELEFASETKELFKYIQNDSTLFVEMFDDCVVTYSRLPNPQEPFVKISDILTNSDDLYLIGRLPILSYQSYNYLESLKGEPNSKILINQNILNKFSYDIKKKITDYTRNDGFVLRILPNGIEYGIILSLEPFSLLCVLVADTDGRLIGIIETNIPDAIKWGREKYESYNLQSQTIS